jgi:hypothetical protein
VDYSIFIIVCYGFYSIYSYKSNISADPISLVLKIHCHSKFAVICFISGLIDIVLIRNLCTLIICVCFCLNWGCRFEKFKFIIAEYSLSLCFLLKFFSFYRFLSFLFFSDFSFFFLSYSAFFFLILLTLIFNEILFSLF